MTRSDQEGGVARDQEGGVAREARSPGARELWAVVMGSE